MMASVLRVFPQCSHKSATSLFEHLGRLDSGQLLLTLLLEGRVIRAIDAFVT